MAININTMQGFDIQKVYDANKSNTGISFDLPSVSTEGMSIQAPQAQGQGQIAPEPNVQAPQAMQFTPEQMERVKKNNEQQQAMNVANPGIETVNNIKSLTTPYGALTNPLSLGGIGRGVGFVSEKLGFGKEEKTTPMQERNQRVDVVTKTELERNYGLRSGDKAIAEMAERGRQNMGLPEGEDDRILAHFVAYKNEDNPEFVDQFKMNRRQAVGNDLVDRAKGVGTSYVNAMNEFAKIQEGRDEYTLNKEFDDTVATVGTLARFANNLVGEAATGAAQLADNLFLAGAADRRIYDYMNKPETQERIQDLINRDSVQSVLDRIEKNPNEARTLGDILSIGELGAEFVSLGAAGRAGDILQQGARQVIGESAEQAIRQGVSGARDAVRGGLTGIGQGIQRVPGVKKITDLGKKGLDNIANTMGGFASGIGEAITGVKRETQRALFDPTVRKYMDQMADGSKTVEQIFQETIITPLQNARKELIDIGTQYDSVKKQDVKIKKSDIKKNIDDILKIAGIKNKKGKLDFGDSKIGDQKGMSAVQKAYGFLNRGNMTPDIAINQRHKLDDLVNWNAGVGGKGEKLVKEMRKAYDKILKEKIPGLREVDSKYAPLIESIMKAEKDYLDSSGNIKDSAISKFVNVSNDRNIERLKRINVFSPDVEEASRAIKAVEDIEFAGGNRAGQYTKSFLQQVGLSNIIGFGGAGAAGIGATQGDTSSIGVGLVVFALTRPSVFVRMLKKVADLRKTRVAGATTSSSQLANEMIDKTIDGTFDVNDAKRLQNVVIKDKQVRDSIIEEVTPPEFVDDTIKQVDEIIGEYRQAGGTTDNVGVQRQVDTTGVQQTDEVQRALPGAKRSDNVNNNSIDTNETDEIQARELFDNEVEPTNNDMQARGVSQVNKNDMGVDAGTNTVGQTNDIPQDLLEEAKKYDSADEFIEAKATLYRGTDEKGVALRSKDIKTKSQLRKIREEANK